MKDKILKEFKSKFVIHCSDGDILDGMVDVKDVIKFLDKAISQTREETLKELIREYQDNELDGKDYDFYFSIRAKIEKLNKLKK